MADYSKVKTSIHDFGEIKNTYLHFVFEKVTSQQVRRCGDWKEALCSATNALKYLLRKHKNCDEDPNLFKFLQKKI